jgi:hypothetical protein
MAGAALLGFGRDHPDVFRQGARDLFEYLQAGSVDAVIVGNQDTSVGEFDWISLRHLF